MTGRAIVAVMLVVVLLPAFGLGLHVASALVADQDAVAQAVRDASESGTLVDQDQPEGPARFLPSWYSDCITLSILLREQHTRGIAPLIRNEAVAWNPSENICRTLQRGVDAPSTVGWFSYARYWHGNLVLHRLGLSVLDYGNFRLVLAGLMALSFIVFARYASKTVTVAGLVVFVGPVLFATDINLAAQMPTQAISLTALLFCAALVFSQVRAGGAGLLLAAFAAGAIYNYFDFLYNPALLAGLAAFGVAASARDQAFLAVMRRVIGVFVLVFSGYVVMWGAKWGLAELQNHLSGDPSAIILAQDFLRWAGTGRGEIPFSTAITSIFAKTFESWLATGVFALSAIATVWMCWGRVRGRDLVLALLPLLLALATLAMIAGHTYAHVWFTHRTVPWLIAAGFAILLVRADALRSFRLAR